MNFTQRFNQLCTSKGISGYLLAKELGVSDGMIGFWRRGERLPSAENLAMLADYFNISVDFLLGRTDDPTPPRKPATGDEEFLAAHYEGDDPNIREKMAAISDEERSKSNEE